MSIYDASYQRPAPTLLRPGDGIILYCSRTAAKTPSSAECGAYRNRGVTVSFVFEDSADRAAISGYATGKSDGAFSAGMARANGHPRSWTLWFACDTYTALNLDYARGFRDGLAGYYEPGIYAGDRNLERARTQLGYTKFWQAGASSWSDHWHYPDLPPGDTRSYGTYPYAQLAQVAGNSPIPGTDLDIARAPHWYGPTTDWFDMATQADLQAVLQPLADQLTVIQNGLGMLQYGDGRNATPQTHPFNLYQIWQDVEAIKTKLGIT